MEMERKDEAFDTRNVFGKGESISSRVETGIWPCKDKSRTATGADYYIHVPVPFRSTGVL
jgi:ribosomal protein L37AE/L43A